jgi:hypothetical protein
MIDIESKIMAMKAGWVKHLISERKWNGIMKTVLQELGFNVHLMLKCNFTSVKTFPCITALSEFYQRCIYQL